MIGLLRLEGWIMMKTSVDVETMKQIKMKAHELCKDILPRDQDDISNRNQKIIEILMSEFDISEELALECFRHNNER